MAHTVGRVARRSRRAGALALLTRPRALWRFLRDRDAPALPRVVALLAILYVVLPFDLVPDVAPVLGWLDDAGLSAAALAFVASQAAKHHDRATAARPPSAA